MIDAVCSCKTKLLLCTLKGLFSPSCSLFLEHFYLTPVIASGPREQRIHECSLPATFPCTALAPSGSHPGMSTLCQALTCPRPAGPRATGGGWKGLWGGDCALFMMFVTVPSCDQLQVPNTPGNWSFCPDPSCLEQGS